MPPFPHKHIHVVIPVEHTPQKYADKPIQLSLDRNQAERVVVHSDHRRFNPRLLRSICPRAKHLTPICRRCLRCMHGCGWL